MTDRAAGVAASVGDDTRSLSSYFYAFGPAPDWNDLVAWPPDVFALTNLVLDHTESYRFVVAPPAGRRWPPLPDWDEEVRAAAHGWREAVGSGSVPPLFVRRSWDVVTRQRRAHVAAVRTGQAWELTTALLTLHAIADEACAHVGSHERRGVAHSLEDRAWALLQERGSLARLSPTRVRIVPKAQFSGHGITIRSLSRYLALCYESVELRWRSVGDVRSCPRDEYGLLLLPWPLSVAAADFRPAPLELLDNMDLDRFGFFEFAPKPSLDVRPVGPLLRAAAAEGHRVDAVVFPEAAVPPGAISRLERTLARHGATFLVAGVSHRATGSELGRNYLHFGVRTATGWERHEQDKHHRWHLDEQQIRQYHLSRSLRPGRQWWEAIDVRERTLHIVDVGGGVTAAPLVCEDLARPDEVADLVRRVGPSLIVAILLDGPQLVSRWPSRYASVIADDPGSAVLTLTSLGMASRCLPTGTRRSRVVAQWNTRADGPREIGLAAGAVGVLLTTSVEGSTLWTADGRRHPDVPRLRLSGVHQLRLPPARATGRRLALGKATSRSPSTG